jgi:hypothetical protein
LGTISEVDLEDSARRVETAFLSSVCGCVLGKPLEINPTLGQIRTALERIGEWPMNDYISERTAEQGFLIKNRRTTAEQNKYASKSDQEFT